MSVRIIPIRDIQIHVYIALRHMNMLILLICLHPFYQTLSIKSKLVRIPDSMSATIRLFGEPQKKEKEFKNPYTKSKPRTTRLLSSWKYRGKVHYSTPSAYKKKN